MVRQCSDAPAGHCPVQRLAKVSSSSIREGYINALDSFTGVPSIIAESSTGAKFRSFPNIVLWLST